MDDEVLGGPKLSMCYMPVANKDNLCGHCNCSDHKDKVWLISLLADHLY